MEGREGYRYEKLVILFEGIFEYIFMIDHTELKKSSILCIDRGFVVVVGEKRQRKITRVYVGMKRQ